MTIPAKPAGDHDGQAAVTPSLGTRSGIAIADHAPMNADTDRIGRVLITHAFKVEARVAGIGAPDGIGAERLPSNVTRQRVEVAPEAFRGSRNH